MTHMVSATICVMESKSTIYLTGDMQHQLKNVAKRKGISQAHVIREALAEYLVKEELPLPRSIGVAKDGSIGGAEAKEWARREWRQKWSH